MEILNLKDSVEKDTFFRKLPTLAEQLPREIVLKKVFYYFLQVLTTMLHMCFLNIIFFLDLQFLPLLASALEFGSATAPALTAFLKMGAWLSPEEFNKKVFQIFTVRLFVFCAAL